MKQGVQWRVGNGSDIRVYGDKWLPRVSSCEVMSPRPFLHLDTRKCELIHSETSCWKEEVIRQIFLPLDVEAILSILLSAWLLSDCLIWAESNNGSFSIQSAYKVAMNLHRSTNAASGSTDSSLHVFWKKLWRLPTPHKVRHFAWRACRDILPTKDNLQHCRVLSENLCDECGTVTESSSHFF